MTDFDVLRQMLAAVGRIQFKIDLVKELRSLYKHDPNPARWLSRLDGDDMLLGCEDCVYDFREKRFREGRPEDMVSMSTGHTRADLEANDGLTEEIMEAIGNMHQPDELSYMINTLATSVVGDRPNDVFHIWSGTGANGKGLTKNLVATTFGEYYYEPSAGLFATRSVSGSVLSSELAKLKGRRVVIASEAESGDKLRAGLLKQCSGHDLIQARDLYKTADEFRCVANIILCFNEIPGVDDSSGGIERRLRLLRFRNKFMENPTALGHRRIDTTLQAKFCSKKYGAAFLAYLIRTFNEYGFAFETPASVRNDAKSYVRDNNLLEEFMKTFFEAAPEGNFIPLKEVWNILREERCYFEQLQIKHSQQLSQKLRNMGYEMDRKFKGMVLLNLRERKKTDDDDTSDDE
jgi:P4 family phage/plasmid primase-like protien